MYPSKVVQKNMFKAWNYTKNNLHHKWIDNNLQKILRTNIPQNVTGQILLMIVWMVGICLDIWPKFQMVSWL